MTVQARQSEDRAAWDSFFSVWGRDDSRGLVRSPLCRAMVAAQRAGPRQREFAAENTPAAKARLARLVKRWPAQSDVLYWLAACERAEGHTEQALEIWGRIPDDAPEAMIAALSRGRLAAETGHYAIAEPSLERASHASGDIGREARSLLGRLHRMIGRHDLYREQLRRDAQRERDPSATLRALWEVEHNAIPIAQTTEALAQARRAAPNDDRVWLALANLATRSDRISAAGDLLDRCEQTRPADVSVWLARLDWAQAAGRRDEVLRAASHLSETVLSRSEALALRAWVAAREGAPHDEESALLELVALEPSHPVALERLADLAAAQGKRERVAELRRQKTASDAARDRYQVLVNLPDAPSHAAELARLATQIDRPFEARMWWSLASRLDPAAQAEATAALARLAKLEADALPARAVGSLTLAELLGHARRAGAKQPQLAGTRSIPHFTDEAQRWGVVFTFDNGQSDHRHLPETMSGGVALLDFDGDGWLDIYAVQGGPFPPPSDRPAPFGDRLFRNRGGRRFEDATASSGLRGLPGGYGHAAAVGDYDNDGRPDVLVTRWRSYALYHNIGNGRFEDATARSGLGNATDWPISAAWADLDNDGDLDLYVCHYLKYDPETAPICRYRDNPAVVPCDPRSFAALPDHVFRNDGNRFVDVTEQAGIIDRNGRGMGVVAADLDSDGKVDLFVANDTTANYFFRNLGGFRFVEQAQEAGLASNSAGGYLAGMGVACGDLDGDGRLDLAVTNFLGESTTLYHNHGDGLFTDRTTAAGLAAPTRFVLGFGLAMLDSNNDGHLDLAQANGHIGDYRPALPYAMPAQLFLGDGTGKLVEVSGRAGAPWAVERLRAGWQRATSTTTAVSTSCSYRRTLRSPFFTTSLVPRISIGLDVKLTSW